MAKLTETLAKIISDTVQSCIAARPDSEVRMVLRGLPVDILNELFSDYVANGGVQIPNHNPIRVLFIDDKFQDDGNSLCSRCTVEDVVNSRNVRQTLLVLLPIGNHLNLSTESSVSFIGLTPDTIRGRQKFSLDPFVTIILEEIRKSFTDAGQNWDQLFTVIDFALLNWGTHGDSDRTQTPLDEYWNLLGKILEIDDNADLLIARCGLPSIDVREIGTKEHLQILGDLAQFIEENGFRTAREALVNEAEEDQIEYVEKFFDFLFAKKCESPPDFAKAPAYFYSQQTIPEEWWNILSFDVWSNLLQSTKPVKQESIEIECCNPIINHSVKGLPWIVQDFPSLRIRTKGESVPEKFKIYRGQGKNPRLEAEILNNEFWTPNEVPFHISKLNYRIIADSGYKPANIRIISMENYEPGIIVFCSAAHKISPPKKRTTKGRSNIDIWECDLEVSTSGVFLVELILASHTIIGDAAVSLNATSENIEQTVEIGQADMNRRRFYAETDEESTYCITVTESRIGQFKLHMHFHAENEDLTGVANVFDALVMDNVRGKSSASTVEINWGYRIYDLERRILKTPYACYPLIISGDYLSKLADNLEWNKAPILSDLSCENDVRPEFKDWHVPDMFIEARTQILKYLNENISGDEPLIELFRFDLSMREEKFRDLVLKYIEVYEDWIANDYESAILADAYMVIPPERNTSGLSNEPEAILMTPLHPLRFAWHCLAHKVLAETAYDSIRCPAAGIIDPHLVPDIIQVPCIQPDGKTDRIPFVAIRNSSPYWGVLWNGRKLSDLNDSPLSGLWGDAWGISISSISSGFNKAQVKRAISDVRDIRIAKNTIRVLVTSDTQGISTCNDGIIEWCQENLGDVEKDEWAPACGRRLDVLDMRNNDLNPSSAVIADLTDKTDAQARWWIRPENKVSSDLCIIENLGEHLPKMNYGKVRSPIGWGGLIRKRVRRHIKPNHGGARFLQESRAGRYYGDDSDDYLSHKVGTVMSLMEGGALRDDGDEIPSSYYYTPSLETLTDSFKKSAYLALSSASVDSTCFFGQHGDTYLWDYNLPNYSTKSGESNGFYLLVRENPTLISSIRVAIDEFELSTSESLTEDDINDIIVEISHRGMPTLKRISGGGAAAVGEFGTFVALRLLQDSFIKGNKNGCIIPARGTSDSGYNTINLIVPMDPFQTQFDSLRKASEGGAISLKRPDLIVFSIALDSIGTPVALKITPIEIKARTSEFSSDEMLSAIDQAKVFSSYIKKMLYHDSEDGLGKLWDIAIKDFLSSLISFGFRVYGLLDECGNDNEEWSQLHEKVIGELFLGRLPIDIDGLGRLIVVDKSSKSRSLDLENDLFEEVIILCAEDAIKILKNTSNTLISDILNRIDDWGLNSRVKGVQINYWGTNDEDAVEDTSEHGNAAAETPQTELSPSGEGEKIIPDATDSNIQSAEINDALKYGIKFKVGETINSFSKLERDFWPSNTGLNQINIGIVGDLGTGKTQLIKALIYQIVKRSATNRNHSPRFLIFDYKNDYSSEDFIKAVGANVLEPFDLPLNIFDVSGCTGRKPWMERYRFFGDVLSKIYGGIGQVQLQNLKNAVRSAYDKAEAEGVSAPVLEQVYQEYLDVTNGKADSPTNIISDLIDLDIFETDVNKIIPFEKFLDGVVVIKLSSLGQDDKTKNLLVVIFLNFFYEYMLKLEKKPFIGNDPQLRFINSMLLVDEADSIMKYEFDVLRKILLQGREFGVGVLLSSQYLSHFRRQEMNYIEPLLTWFIHKVPNITIKELESIGLTKADNEMLSGIRALQPHECLLKTLNVNGDFIRGIPFYKLIAESG